MGEKLPLFTRLRSIRALLLVSWALSVAVLVIFATSISTNTVYNKAQNWEPTLRLPVNQIRGFSYRHCDPKQNGRPVRTISFKSLLAENNNFGIFKTATHKVMKIWDLKLVFYRYTSPKIGSSTNFGSEKAGEIATPVLSEHSGVATSNTYAKPEGTNTNAEEFLDEMRSLINPKNDWRVNIDISNVSEVQVTNLNFGVFYDRVLLLGVRSKRAMVSNKQPEMITLRGHVVVKTINGNVLESNYVTWDTRKQCFTAKGTYFLTCNGKKMQGKGICVDDRLNIVQVQIAASEERSGKNG